MSPYGGLIRYWDHLLRGLEASDVPVRILRPTRPRALLPSVTEAREQDAKRWVFHSTYLSKPPENAAAEVFTVHDTIFEDFPDLARWMDPSGEDRHARRASIASANRLIVPSQTTRTGLVRHYAGCADRVSFIPSGVDHCFFGPPRLEAALARDRLLAAIDTERPYLLHVGGREHHKNFEFLLSTYVTTSLHRHFDLLVVGSQPRALPREKEILSSAHGEGVSFIGQVSHSVLVALYRSAAVLVAPSLAEGFGFPPLEAAAGGTPVAHSSIGIFKETMGDGGWPFDPTSCADAERAILAAASADIIRQRRLKSRVATRFDWHSTVGSVLLEYARVAGSSRV